MEELIQDILENIKPGDWDKNKSIVRDILLRRNVVIPTVAKSKIEKFYNEKGDATHYDTNRLNAINKYERVYGTLATMTFCEITADRYRERVGKKDNQSLEQEVLKISWYEKAAQYYFNKLGTVDEIQIDNKLKLGLPWKE